MDLNEIKTFLGPTIYSRATGYYRSGMIREIENISPGRVIAFVEGSYYMPYKVEVDLIDDIIDCNCPYDDICKHIGAVLIHQYHHRPGFYSNIAVGSTFSNLAESIDKAKREIESKENRVYYIEDFRKDKKNFKLFPEWEETLPVKGKRYRLVFLISSSRGEAAAFSPKAVYIKKNGSPGSIQRFTPEKITEPTDRTAMTLATEICNKGDEWVPLSDFFDIVVDRPDLFFFKKDNELLPLQLVSLNDFYFFCDLHSLDDDEIIFDIKLAQANSDDSQDITFITLKDMEKHNLLHYGITRSNELVYYSNNMDLFRLFERLKSIEPVTFPKIKALEDYCSRLDPPIRVHFPFKKLQVLSTPPKTIIEIEKMKKSLKAKVIFDYGGTEAPQDSQTRLIYNEFDRGSKTLTLIKTEPDYENLIVADIEVLFQDKITFPFYNNYYYETARSDNFILEDYTFIELIREHGKEFVDRNYEIRLKNSNITLSACSGKVITRVESGIDWFDCSIEFQMDDEEEARAIDLDIRLLLQGLVKSGNNYHVLTREEIERLKDLYEEGLSTRGKIRIAKSNLSLIDKLYQESTGSVRDILEERAAIYKKLINMKSMSGYNLPKKYKTKLRKYQKEGYRWLMFLHDHGLNGCLADDMGLGKTVQCLAALQKLKEESTLGNSLIVVPVSTIANWISEIERFTEGITSYEYMGSARMKDEDRLREYDLIITSYRTMSRDIELFASMDFHYLILDEAQNIKNSASQTFKAVKALRAKTRLSLTGTPVENSTHELWSQMDFLNPGLLGGRKGFQNRYARAIEKDNDSQAAESLRKKTSPFILRRKKEDVAIDLPDKEEIIYYAEMGPRQWKLYDSIRKQYRSDLEETLSRKKVGQSAFEIFEALLRLRQAALMPRVIDKKFASIESCKFEALKEMVGEIIAEDHKVLVFSQFVKVLDVIREHFDEKKVSYSYIDGSTRKRAQQIKAFQEDEKRKLFLLSLKAGGVGINLTAADYVIIFDPWWNPAVEAQAIDRSHRIGQTRRVIAYKYIVKNTIEEKILELQQKKKKLVDDIISDESTLLTSLSKNEIMDLFS